MTLANDLQMDPEHSLGNATNDSLAGRTAVKAELDAGSAAPRGDSAAERYVLTGPTEVHVEDGKTFHAHRMVVICPEDGCRFHWKPDEAVSRLDGDPLQVLRT